MPVRRLLAVTCVVPLLLVAACQADEPEPKMPTPSPSASSTSPPTTTPTVDPLAIPAGAKEPTKAGAEVLVRHYYDVFNGFLSTGEPAPLRKTYVRTCTYCEASVQVFGYGQSKGHVYKGSEVVLTARSDLLGDVGGLESAVVFVTSDQSAIEEYDGDQVVSRIDPVPANKHDFYLAFQDGQWKITNVEAVK